MKHKIFKAMPAIFAAIVILVVAIVLGSCGRAGNKGITATKTEEIVIVVPSDGKSIISSLISGYEKQHNDVSVKVINIGGTAEEIHRFCVSTLMDSNFGADLLIIDDIWLSEFVSAGLVSPIADISEYDFIPAAKRGMAYDGKIYGVPIYADAMVDFCKYESSSGKSMYFEDNVNDTSAYIRNEVAGGITAEAAYEKYLKAVRSDNLAEFTEQDAETMRGWLSQFDAIQKYYPKVARKIKISMTEKSLIKSKLAIINSKSDKKDRALAVVKHLLSEDSQLEIMRNITSLPVLRRTYKDPVMLDRFPHINSVSGDGFSTFPFLPEYNMAEKKLSELIESDAPPDETVGALWYLEK